MEPPPSEKLPAPVEAPPAGVRVALGLAAMGGALVALVLGVPLALLALPVFFLGGLPWLVAMLSQLALPFTVLLFLGGGLLGALAMTGRLPRALRWLWEGETERRALEAQGHLRILPAPAGETHELPEGAHCVYCGDPLLGRPLVRCTRCETPFHEDCWEASRRCAVFGCGAQEAARLPQGPTGSPSTREPRAS